MTLTVDKNLIIGILVGIVAGIAVYWVCFRKFCKRRAQERWLEQVDRKYKRMQKRKEKKEMKKNGGGGNNKSKEDEKAATAEETVTPGVETEKEVEVKDEEAKKNE